MSEYIELNNISYKGYVDFPLLGNVIEIVDDISIQLNKGKCYCLNSKLTEGGWGLSWLLAGEIDPNYGIIKVDNKIITKQKRKSISQRVGLDASNINIFEKKTIRKQIEKGLRINGNFNSYQNIIDKFELCEEKLNRTIEQVSAMRFKASIAIGYAFKKEIYCFPWMKPEWVLSFKDLWLSKMIKILKDNDCYIIIPTEYDDKMRNIFDEVIYLKK